MHCFRIASRRYRFAQCSSQMIAQASYSQMQCFHPCITLQLPSQPPKFAWRESKRSRSSTKSGETFGDIQKLYINIRYKNFGPIDGKAIWLTETQYLIARITCECLYNQTRFFNASWLDALYTDIDRLGTVVLTQFSLGILSVHFIAQDCFTKVQA